MLFAAAGAVQLRDEETVDLQIGVEAQARINVRAELRENLAEFLYRGDAFPETILPNSKPVARSDLPASTPIRDMEFTNVQVSDEWGRGLYAGTKEELKYPESILPGPVAIAKADLPADSDPDVAFLQIHDDEMSVEAARIQAAQMQAQMDQAIAQADAKRAEQQAQYEASINNNDPASQLQGLMNAQASLHRLTSAFSAKPNLDKVTGMAQKLGIPMTPELMQLGTNEAISNALVEIAVGMGKTEEEIAKALD